MRSLRPGPRAPAGTAEADERGLTDLYLRHGAALMTFVLRLVRRRAQRRPDQSGDGRINRRDLKAIGVASNIETVTFHINGDPA